MTGALLLGRGPALARNGSGTGHCTSLQPRSPCSGWYPSSSSHSSFSDVSSTATAAVAYPTAPACAALLGKPGTAQPCSTSYAVSSRAAFMRRPNSTRVHASKQQQAEQQGKGSKGQQKAPKGSKDDGEEEDGFLNQEDDEEGEWLIDLEGDEGEDDLFYDLDEGEDDEGGEIDDAALLGLEADEAAPGVDTGNAAWAERALAAATQVLKGPGMEQLQLYVFRALPGTRKLDIRLDRLDDPYGSPSIDDIERFSRALYPALEEALGPEAAGEVSLEVSSPGAERVLKMPEELSRFGALPLKVEYTGADGAQVTQVLELIEHDQAQGLTKWRLADVRANAPVKGRALSKRQRAAVYDIPVPSITRARVFVDF